VVKSPIPIEPLKPKDITNEWAQSKWENRKLYHVTSRPIILRRRGYLNRYKTKYGFIGATTNPWRYVSPAWGLAPFITHRWVFEIDEKEIPHFKPVIYPIFYNQEREYSLKWQLRIMTGDEVYHEYGKDWYRFCGHHWFIYENEFRTFKDIVKIHYVGRVGKFPVPKTPISS